MTTTTSTMTSGVEPTLDVSNQTTKVLARAEAYEIQTTLRQQIIPKTLRWRPLPAPLVEHAASSPLAVLRIPDGPVPCRRCLQDSKVGEEMLLMSYDPFLGDSPYRCASPIYVHAKSSCELAVFQASGGGLLPEQQRTRRLAVRAYDGKHMMQDAEVIDGDDLLETCQRLLGDDTSAEYCHVHYVAPGCFAVRVEKASSKGN